MSTWLPSRWPEAARAAVLALERELVGFSLPPAGDELDRSGWSPDPPGAWCGRCGAGRPAVARSSRGCPECRGRRLPFESIVRLGGYGEPLDGWILRIKRRAWHAMAERLGDLLAAQCLVAWGPRPIDAVVPVPMPTVRRIWRGIDHSSALAARVAKAFRVPLVHALVHAGGRTQVGRSRTERLRRRSPFRLHPRVERPSRWPNMVLVDDVLSTGSTIRQAANLLRELDDSVRVRVAVAAVAELDASQARPIQPFSRLEGLDS